MAWFNTIGIIDVKGIVTISGAQVSIERADCTIRLVVFEIIVDLMSLTSKSTTS
jgi:hypothetical protein